MTATTISPDAGRDTNRSRRTLPKDVLIPVILVLLGVAVLLYPVAATQLNNFHQQKVADEYAKLQQDADPAVLNKAIEDARSYNSRIATGPILDPWLARVTEDNVEYRDYLSQLNQFEAMGRLVVPAADINLPIYHGTDEDTLQKGVGHLFGSHLPVGGLGTHSVLTGHTGLPNATLFDNLDAVHEGDAIYLEVSGERLKYEVTETEVVLPNETESLRPVTGQDQVTLITCTPYGINTHRLLVHAHRVEMTPEDDAAIDSAGGAHWQWWMWALIAGAVAILIALVWWVRRQLSTASEAGEENIEDSVSVLDLLENYEWRRGDNE